MDKRYLTILVLSNDSSKTKKLKIPVGLYKFLRNSLILVLILFGYICYDYADMRVKSLELKEVRKENIAQKIELDAFSHKIGEVENQLAKLREFDQKIRIIANIEAPEEDGQKSMGMGGTSLEEVSVLTAEDKRKRLIEDMHSDLSFLKSEADEQEKRFSDLKTHLNEKASVLASTPSIWPVRGWLSSGFGKRKSPFTGLTQKHSGLDIANRTGTAIMAPADGTVVFVGRKSALGKTIIIKHGYGLKTTYGHLNKYNVKRGARVKRGQKIAEMGNTGRSTGPHLHYDVALNGVSVNPMKYILN